MEIKSEAKFVRLAPEKARAISRAVQGLSVAEALNITEFNPQKGAFELGKVLKTAIANAENNFKLPADRLYVKEAVVLNAPVMKRYWSRSRGQVSPIKRPLGHIRIILAETAGSKAE